MLVMEHIGTNKFKLIGVDSLLHVGICCKSLASPVFSSWFEKMESLGGRSGCREDGPEPPRCSTVTGHKPSCSMKPNNHLNAMCYTASEGNWVFTVMISYYWRTSCRNYLRSDVRTVKTCLFKCSITDMLLLFLLSVNTRGVCDNWKMKATFGR
jgi:hypothetical protein